MADVTCSLLSLPLLSNKFHNLKIIFYQTFLLIVYKSMPLFMHHAILIMIVLRTGRVKLDQFLDIMEVSLCRGSTKHCFLGLHEKHLFNSKVRKTTRAKQPNLPNKFLSVNIPFFLLVFTRKYICRNITWTYHQRSS
jgi:hypothetical protein